MHPWLLKYPPVSTYGAMIVTALVVAWIWARLRTRAFGVEPSHIDLLMPLLVGVGLAGAWAFGGLTDSLTGEDAHGAVLVGSLLLSTAAGIGFGVACGIPLGVLGDICAAPLALGIAIGRVGCFFAGCCFGKISGLSGLLTAVTFPKDSFAYAGQVSHGQLMSDAAASLPVYPVQLYESALCGVLALLLWRWLNWGGKRLISGERFLAMGVGYAVIRFCVEFLRADNPAVVRVGAHWGFTFSQCAAIFILAVVGVTWMVRRKYAQRWKLMETDRPSIFESLPPNQ